MGLFDGASKKENAENELLQIFSQIPILDDIVNTIIENPQEWITKCQSYYDSRNRQVTISQDLFQIKWSEYRYEQDKRVEEVGGKVSYSYTSSGYTPLHSHVNEKGREDVSLCRVMYLWASIVRERLQAKMPDCQFGSVIEYESYSTFTYTVPALTWKQWF